VRLLVEPTTDQQRQMVLTSVELFRRAHTRTANLTTSDATVAEDIHILTKIYGRSRVEAASGRRRLLILPGIRAPQKESWMKALALWSESSSLSFVDVLAATYVRPEGFSLATFDKDLATLPDIQMYSSR
jgi:predicted nucleic acid-binding protein